MRSLPILLNEVISEQFHFSNVSKSNLRLLEEKTGLSVVFNILPNETHHAACFQFDKDKKSKTDPVFPFFETTKKGLCIKNDFILIYQKGKKVYVFLIELKSKNTGEYLNQLRAGKIFIEFIMNRIKLASKDWADFDLKEFDKLDLIYKAILFRLKDNSDNRDSVTRKNQEKGTSRHSKLPFETLDDFDVYHQSYNNEYHLSQFI